MQKLRITAFSTCTYTSDGELGNVCIHVPQCICFTTGLAGESGVDIGFPSTQILFVDLPIVQVPKQLQLHTKQIKVCGRKVRLCGQGRGQAF